MERKFNKYGKPLPNKSDLKYLKFVDNVLRKSLVRYIENELDDMYGEDPETDDKHHFYNEMIYGFYDDITTDISELAEKIASGENIKNSEGIPLYHILLTQWMEWFFKTANYRDLRSAAMGFWGKGWMPDIMNKLGLDFEDSYTLTLLWLNNELKKYGASVPEIENNIIETKELIRKILREQIITNEHSICGILTCNKLDEVLDKIDYDKLSPLQKERLEKIKSNYKRDVTNNLKDVPKNGGLKGATGDSEKDFCDEYLSEIQTLICEPTQE
jgi:hypothetical protein